MFFTLCVLGFILSAATAPAQSYQIHNLRYLPPDYYVGDTVEISFTLKTDRTTDLFAPTELPDVEWVKFISLDLDAGPRESRIVIRLIPYHPGTRALPPLDLGNLVLDDVKLFTSSILDSESSRELSGIQPPLMIPGTRTVGAVVISMVFTLPVLLILLFKFIRKRTGHLVRSYKLNLPYRRFQRLIKSIKRSMVSMPEEQFYKSFMDGLKSYLSSRMHEDLHAATTAEVETLLSRTRVHDALVHSIVNIFHQVDRVKFAGEKLLFSDRELLLGEVIEISEALEEWRKKHADF